MTSNARMLENASCGYAEFFQGVCHIGYWVFYVIRSLQEKCACMNGFFYLINRILL